MKILAIESSGPVASAAVLDQGKIIAEQFGEFKITHSETLLPLTKAVVDESGMELGDFDAIAVSGGPGSFTGLRIGSATAKGLGLALDKPLIHVPTLDALAYNIKNESGLLVPIMDARRSQVYTGIYTFEEGNLKVIEGSTAISINELIEKVNALCEENGAYSQVTFTGDGVPVFKELIENECHAQINFAEDRDAFQRAGSVALLGQIIAENGGLISADDEAPEYLRPSQAERVRAEKESESK